MYTASLVLSPYYNQRQLGVLFSAYLGAVFQGLYQIEFMFDCLWGLRRPLAPLQPLAQTLYLRPFIDLAS